MYVPSTFIVGTVSFFFWSMFACIICQYMIVQNGYKNIFKISILFNICSNYEFARLLCVIQY